jgi:DnaJ-class molecular chaperone
LTEEGEGGGGCPDDAPSPRSSPSEGRGGTGYQGGRFEMKNNFALGKYGMVICPLCDGKGFLIKDSEGTEVSVRKVCIKCGGFGAIKKEEDVFLKSEKLDPMERRRSA